MKGALALTLKRLAKPVLRPIYHVGQRIVVRMLQPSIAPLEKEVLQLREALNHAERQSPSAFEPVRCLKPFDPTELAIASREQARDRLQIPRDQFTIISLGAARIENGVREILNAFEQIRYWEADASLYFLGPLRSDLRLHVDDLLRTLELAGCVHFAEPPLKESVYRDYLIAADCGIQLQTDSSGGFSGPLLDCLSAGLPTICNSDLATAMNRPSYSRVVPNHISPLLLAESFWELCQANASRQWDEADRLRNLAEYQQMNFSPQILKLLMAS